MSRETYSIEVAGLTRHLPLFEVAPGVRIAIVNILGDTELVEAVAGELAPKLAKYDPKIEVLVTAEAKSIPLIYALSVALNKMPFVVLRKIYKPYMGETINAETYSITTGQPQQLYLDEKDRELIKGKRVVLLDDVISTGSTLQAMELVMQKAEAEVVVKAAIFTEGDRAKWNDIIALGHLPVFTDS